MSKTLARTLGSFLLGAFAFSAVNADEPVTPEAPAQLIDQRLAEPPINPDKEDSVTTAFAEKPAGPLKFHFGNKAEAESAEKPAAFYHLGNKATEESAEKPAAFYHLGEPVKKAGKGGKGRGNKWFDYNGMVNFGYTFSFNSPLSSSNLPVGFNDQADEFQMNQLYLIFDSKEWVSDNEKWTMTGRLDLLYGTDHFYTTARGLETRLDGSPHWNSVDPANIKRLNATGAAPYYGLAMPQAYVDLETPFMNDMNLRMGHFYSPLGTESVIAKENFFYSHTYNRIYSKPFTHTGLLASTSILNEGLQVSAGFTRGWDNFEDADEDLSVLAGISFEMEGHSFGLNLHSGDDHRYLDNSGVAQAGNVTVTTLQYSRQLGKKGTYILQGDLGYGEAMQTHDTTGTLSEARWYGITNYLIYDYNDEISSGLRVEWFRDQDNARVLGIAVDEEVNGGNYVDITAGLNLRPNDRWIVRSEVRWDWSDVTSDIYGVDGMFNGQTKRDQFTLTLDAIYSF